MEENKKISISDLELAKYNPRQILNEELEKLKNSIRYYSDTLDNTLASGFRLVDPVIINKQNNRVVGGHQRIKALLSLGQNWINAEDVRYIYTDNYNQEKALNLALNKISGDWDTMKLTELLRDLDEANFDLEFTGFDDAEFEELEKMLADEEDEKGEPAAEKELKAKENLTKTEEQIFQENDFFYLALSGGKDSFLALEKILPLVRQYGKEIECCFVDTGVEFPDILPFLYRSCKELRVKLNVIKSRNNFFEVYGKKKKFPSPIYRECINALINNPINDFIFEQRPEGDFVLVKGARKGQSLSRSSKNGQDYFAEITDYKKRPIKTYNPLFNVPEDEKPINLWEGYSKGFTRTACWCCPFQTTEQWEAMEKYYPFLIKELRGMMRGWQYISPKDDYYKKRIDEFFGS